MTVHRSLTLTLFLTLPLAACDKTPKADPPGAAPSASASHTSASVRAHPGCDLGMPAGNLLPKLGLGTLSLATARGRALLVDVQESVDKPTAERLSLAPNATAEGNVEPLDDVLGKKDPAITFAAAMSLGGDLSSLAFSFGVKPPSAAQCPEGAIVLKGAGATGTRRELTKPCHAGTFLRGAARQDLGIALVDGPGVADAFVLDQTATHLVHLETIDKPDAKVIDGAVAVGATSLAAAWIVGSGQNHELHVARVSRSGDLIGKVDVLDKQGVGSVTMAFEADTLHIIWSSYMPEKNRFILKWTKWPASGTPVPSQTIGSGVQSATEPSLAFADGRFVLAWTEQNAIHVGASRAGIAGIPGLATVTASGKGASAGGAVVAVERDAIFVAWRETGESAGVRASTLKCLE